MTSLWELAAAVAALLVWLDAPPTSLAEASRREAFRRQVTARASAAYTNDTLGEARPSDIPQAAPPPATSETTTAVASPASQPPRVVIPGSTLPAPPPADDEKAWRTKLANLKETLARADKLAADLQARIALLQNDFMTRDDPGQRSVLGQELSKALADLDRTKAKLQADRLALEKFHDDARRSGIPPGWLR
jgi:hypothetical protein